MKRIALTGLLFCSMFISSLFGQPFTLSMDESRLKGYQIRETGLVPRYPANYACPPLTSLYASWDDIDGTRRTERHSGVDGGRFGDPILAPSPGVVIAAWNTDWGWGPEGALLIRHTRDDLGLSDGPQYYYSEFDHLQYDEIRSIPEGKRVNRGDQLATVSRPGGNRRFLPEVHWEVWEIDDDSATVWDTNRFGGRYWKNKTGRLIDPLYMLSRDKPPGPDGMVDIPVFERRASYREFRGFTYIFPCRKKTAQPRFRQNR